MSPSRPFILRPVATVLLMVAMVLVGAVAYKQLPVSALPQVDYPTLGDYDRCLASIFTPIDAT